jgi:hypothetical protein
MVTDLDPAKVMADIRRRHAYNDGSHGGRIFDPQVDFLLGEVDRLAAALAEAQEDCERTRQHLTAERIALAEAQKREQRVRALSAKWRQTVIDMTEHNKARGLHWYLEGRADDLDAALNGDVS